MAYVPELHSNFLDVRLYYSVEKDKGWEENEKFRK